MFTKIEKLEGKKRITLRETVLQTPSSESKEGCRHIFISGIAIISHTDFGLVVTVVDEKAIMTD